MTFGQLIKLLRGTRSQETIAADSNLSQTYISQLEQDAHSPTLESARKIARALGCDLEYLVHIWETSEGLNEGTSFDHMSKEEFDNVQAQLAEAIQSKGFSFRRTVLSGDDEILQLASGLDVESRRHLLGMLKKMSPQIAEEIETRKSNIDPGGGREKGGW